MKKEYLAIFLCLIAIALLADITTAQEESEINLFGFELEKVIMLINAWISLFLFFISLIAYKRDGRARLFYVSLAFLIFSVKNFMISSELFFPEVAWFDPAATVLEFAVILSFFYGVLKK